MTSIKLNDDRANKFVTLANLAYEQVGTPLERRHLFINAILEGLKIYGQYETANMVLPRSTPLENASNLKNVILPHFAQGKKCGKIIKKRLENSVEEELHRLAAFVYVCDGNSPSSYTATESFSILRAILSELSQEVQRTIVLPTVQECPTSILPSFESITRGINTDGQTQQKDPNDWLSQLGDPIRSQFMFFRSEDDGDRIIDDESPIMGQKKL